MMRYPHIMFCGLVLAAPLWLCACGGGGTTPDPDAAEVCANDSECDDGAFCNGLETCQPMASDADANGCVLGVRPCAATSACDETARMCEEDCPDADGDGARSAACGGTDCDDANPNRYFGNTEICDEGGQDEDCNPMTLGPDGDGDGAISELCCNGSGTRRVCGTDCDDTSSEIRPGTIDACGAGDEDCDGDIDEDPNQVFYRDVDTDGFGNLAEPLLACERPDGYALRAGDCNLDDPNVNPGATERCNALLIDEDCDGAIDETCDCPSTGMSRLCDGPSDGVCQPGTQTCIAMEERSGWGPCEGRIDPTAETCDTRDEDCDGSVDEDFECASGDVETGTNRCGREGTRICNGLQCEWTTRDFSLLESAATCDYCDDTGQGPDAERIHATADERFDFAIDSEDPLPSAGVFQTLPIGYDGLTLDVSLRAVSPRCSPGGDGWAISVSVEDSEAAARSPWLGVPLVVGLSAQWRRVWVDPDPATCADGRTPRFHRGTLDLMRTAPDAVDHVLLSRSEDSALRELRFGAPHFRRVELRVFPDLPGTAVNETSARVRIHIEGGFAAEIGCGDGLPACGVTIPAGTSVTAAITESGDETYFWNNNRDGLSVDSFMATSALCP